MAVFIVFFSLIVLFIVDIFGQEKIGFRFYATAAYIIGAATSILCGFIGMRIAVISNYRTAYKAKHLLAVALSPSRPPCRLRLRAFRPWASPSTAVHYPWLYRAIMGIGVQDPQYRSTATPDYY